MTATTCLLRAIHPQTSAAALFLHCNACAALQGALFIELWSGARVAACEGFYGGGGMRDGHADQMDGIVLFLVSVCELLWEI